MFVVPSELTRYNGTMTTEVLPYRRSWRIACAFRLSLGGTTLLLAAVAAYLLLTAQAAGGLTQLVLAQTVGLRRITIGRVDGNILSGFTAIDIRIPAPLARYPDSRLEIAEARMAALLAWRAQGPAFSGRTLRLTGSPLAEEITAAAAQGSVLGGITFQEVRFLHTRRLPPGNMIDVQQLDSDWPVGWQQLRSVYNGRLRLAQADPVVFFGQRHQGRVEARVFAKALDIQPFVWNIGAPGGFLAPVQGALNNLDLTISEEDNDWTFNGTFQSERLARSSAVLANTAGIVRLRAQPARRSLEGELLCWGGTLTAKQITILAQPSAVRFTGDPFAPQLELKGRSTVGTTTISLALTGTARTPKLTLTSEPPLAQDTLLAMLVTGKSWYGARAALEGGALSSELATDFIDYAFFGGVGNRMARAFGITDFAITQDPERNLVGAQTTFADRMTLDVQVDPTQRNTSRDATQPSAPREAAPSMPMKLGAEYQVTDRTSIRVEGERTPLEPKTTTEAASSGTTPSLPATDDTILLKVKRRF